LEVKCLLNFSPWLVAVVLVLLAISPYIKFL